MNKQFDLYSEYSIFSERVLESVRKDTFGTDIGQNSWLTAAEFDRFISWLKIKPEYQLLEVASGSGGPASYLAGKTGCRVTGIDSNEPGIAAARERAANFNQSAQLNFRLADANVRLPFADNSFDSLISIDAMNHLPDRLNVLKEWYRVLRPGRKALFTDPVVITGPVTNDELALRSSIGIFLFVPPGINESLIEQSGFHLLQLEDVTDNVEQVSQRWYQARQGYKDALTRIEGSERFEGLQQFFAAVHRLSAERRLSRFVYLIEKSATDFEMNL